MTRLDGKNTRIYCEKKERVENECLISECMVIHFPWGKKNQYGSYLENAINNLTTYAKSYYYNWEKTARDKFMSYTQAGETDAKMSQVFWLWYLSNYRFHLDVSPIIDFYLVEYEDKFDEKMRGVVKALKNSYLSVYRVQWINNNAVGLRDIFCKVDYVIERNFGDVTKMIEEGDLLLLRLVKINNAVIAVGKTVIIKPENEGFLYEEINSCRIHEQVANMEVFLREHGEILCGLVMDLSLGIRKNSLKSCSLTFKKAGLKDDFLRIFKKSEMILLDRNDRLAKLAYYTENNGFKRIYLGMGSLIIVAENRSDIDLIADKIDKLIRSNDFAAVVEWSEGYNFASEEEAEEILLEIMHDKYLEDWLNTPKRELDNMTPLEAVKDLRGRVLLENLLNDLEFMEIKARSLGEYCLPVHVIREKLNLDKSKINKEMLAPEAIAVRVSKFRARQELSPYVAAYNWIKESYRQIAAAFYNLYYNIPAERKRLAWIIFMWNEFSTIFRPRVYKPEWWMAALEFSYLELSGEKNFFSKIGKKFGVASSLISKNSQLITRHFTLYPLDFSAPLASYPRFEELDTGDRIRSYEEVWNYLRIFENTINEQEKSKAEECKKGFYSFINENRKFWNKHNKETYEKFWQKAALLDLVYANEKTLANVFWDTHACMFPPHLKTAAFNMMMSYVGAYWVSLDDDTGIWLEDIFTGEKYKIYGILHGRIKEKIVPGMVCITRLLPLMDSYWILSPVFIVMPEISDAFMLKIQMFLEEYHPYDASDFNYLKTRGHIILKAYLMTLDEMEQSTLNLMNQPLEIFWQTADLINPDRVILQLKKHNKFRLLAEDEASVSFLWASFAQDQNYQWGYVLIIDNKLFFTTPPGKDQNKLIKDIRKAFKGEDIVILFRGYSGSFRSLKHLETYMVGDLAVFFNEHPEMSLALLRQDDLGDEEIEMTQGIFLLKLGSRLMEYLQESRI